MTKKELKMKEAYHTFDELFDDLSKKDTGYQKIFWKDNYHRERQRPKLNYGFNQWLKSKKGLEPGDTLQEDPILIADFLFYHSEAKCGRDEIKSRPESFKDIFVKPDWSKYISVLETTKPALINSDWVFVGNAKKHKGVICRWIAILKNKGEIKQSVNRTQLAYVLNKEIKGLNLGKDGKTIDNISREFDETFKKQLESLLK